MRRSTAVSMLLLAAALPLAAACDVVIDLDPDAGAPGVRAIWDPRVCEGDPRARIEIRVEDGAGASVVDATACAEGSLELAVGHVGWYQASAVALDRTGGGRALASAVIAIDGPSVRWQVPW